MINIIFFVIGIVCLTSIILFILKREAYMTNIILGLILISTGLYFLCGWESISLAIGLYLLFIDFMNKIINIYVNKK